MKLMLEIDTLAHRMRVDVSGESSRAAEVEAAYAARRFAGLLHPYVLEFELITSVGVAIEAAPQQTEGDAT